MKHRALALLAAGVVALAAGCGGVTPPTGWTAPVATENQLVLVQDRPGQVVALNPKDGAAVWHFPADVKASKSGGRVPKVKGPFYANPVVDKGTVYLVSYEGHAIRLDSDGGELGAPWQVELKTTVVATPLLRGGRLYVFAEDGHVIVLDVKNGNTVATYRPTNGRVWGAPALRGDTIYIGSLDSSELVAMNADSGVTTWKQHLAGATAADLVLDRDLLLVGSFDRALHALDSAASGVERWRFDGDGWFMGAPLAAGGAIYAATMRGSVYGLTDAGKETWHNTYLDAEFRASPILAGGTLVVVMRNGTAIGLDPATGTERWTQAVPGQRVDANGLLLESKLFYITTSRDVLRVDPTNGVPVEVISIQPPSGGGK